MSMLRQRLMWPQKGDKVEIYKKGRLIASGVVLNAEQEKVSIMGSDMIFLDRAELHEGINNGTVTIKKS